MNTFILLSEKAYIGISDNVSICFRGGDFSLTAYMVELRNLFY